MLTVVNGVGVLTPRKIKFSNFKYSFGCRRINVNKELIECIPNKPGCVNCLCTSCEHSTGFCLARSPRHCRPQEITVDYCLYYKSINPVNDGDTPRKKYDYRSVKIPLKS